MEIVNSRAEAYAARYTSPTDALISEVEHYTMQHHAHANMLSGAVQGKLLEAISRILRPRRILEIGTFT
ncbi:MAG TPA: methyltransferase, partial [Ginsengibacter sp.]|nr:methyltransferase [Ginsengibacter sp.]